MNRLLIVLSFLLCCTYPLQAEFLKVLPGKQLRFPQDHGSHPGYPTEWWYFTGHVQNNTRSFGFELTFFRIAVNSEQSQSEWHTSSLYLAHFAVTDDQNKTLLFSEKTGRPALRQAGASETMLKVWLDGWQANMQGEKIFLKASGIDKATAQKFSIDFTLRPKKPVVLHGDRGFSQKGAESGAASYYSSFTRLLGSGALSIGGESFPDSSISAWMDHEVVSFNASSGKLGWDWFAIQLDNGEELMLYYLRDNERISSFSAGTFVAKDGRVTALKRTDFTIASTDTWKSPASGITYPAGWKISVPSLSLELLVKPTVSDQEIRSKDSTGMNYWEGRCLVQGLRAGSPVQGQAYAELVGYRPDKQ